MKVELEFEVDDIDWEDNSYVEVMQTSKNCVGINANKEGLISLAKQILSVAYSDDDFMIHHWAELNKGSEERYFYGDLEEGSLDFFICKTDKKGRRKVD